MASKAQDHQPAIFCDPGNMRHNCGSQLQPRLPNLDVGVVVEILIIMAPYPKPLTVFPLRERSYHYFPSRRTHWSKLAKTQLNSVKRLNLNVVQLLHFIPDMLRRDDTPSSTSVTNSSPMRFQAPARFASHNC